MGHFRILIFEHFFRKLYSYFFLEQSFPCVKELFEYFFTTLNFKALQDQF